MKKFINLILLASSLFFTNPLFAASSDSLVKGLNDFAFTLFSKVQNPEQNSVISPYSLSSLLGILANGAKGNTQTQLLHLLNAENSDLLLLNQTMEQINRSITLNSQSRDTIIANALWGDKSLTYKASFINPLQTSRYVKFYRADFINKPEKSRKEINDWVVYQTKNKIQELIPKGLISSDTRLVLTNAVYFKGLWELPFKASETKTSTFTLLKGGSVEVPMMHIQDKFMYAENDGLKLLRLNYTKTPLAMLILLPKNNQCLATLQSSLIADQLAELLAKAHTKEVNVYLPKFSIESTFDSLNQPLQTMGASDAFSSNADFSNLSSDSLFISEIVHKAKITVDEKGTEAAAASGSVINVTSYEPPAEFNANHPFLFLLWDTKSKAILFIGQVVNPSL